MSTETTRSILDRVIALGIENYEKIADEILAEDHVNHGPETDHGRTAWKERQAQFLTAFPDNEWSIEAALADGDVGAIHYNVSGTHTGQLENIAPTGNRVSISGATFFRVADGKVAETWSYPDRLALLEQLGLRVVD